MKNLLFFIGLICSFNLFGQSLSNEVIGSAGDYYTSSEATVSWTIGEVMTDTYTGGSNQLTQGFHQPTNSHLGLNDFQSALVHVYPNPSSGIYYLDLTDGPDQIQVTVLDARGRLVLTQTLNGTGSQLIDLSDVESGMYILKLFHQDQEIFAPIKLQKTL